MTIENHKIKIFNGTYEEYAAKKHQATDTSADDVKKQIIIMQHRLTEIISRLSMPAKGEAVEALDQEYYEVLDKLRQLQDRLGKGS